MKPLLQSAAIMAAFMTAVIGTAAAETYPLHEVYSRDPAVVVARTTIPLGDLDLATSADTHRLLGRIERAADQVCGGNVRALSKAEKADQRACRAQAISDAVARMQSRPLTALWMASERR